MNGTPIENLRYDPQVPQMQQQFQAPMSISPNMPDSDLVNDDMRRHVNMDMLTREVTDTLDDITIPEQQMEQQMHQQKIQRKKNWNQQNVNNSNIGNSLMRNVPDYLREPLIIFVIYMILSFDVVKKALASYIPQLKPSTDGNVQIVGIAVYGMILGIIYSVMKKLLL